MARPEEHYGEVPEPVSLEDRAPQFNAANCGCRCACAGCVCGGEEDSGSEADGAMVLLPDGLDAYPDGVSGDESEPEAPEGPERAPAAMRAEIEAPRPFRRWSDDQYIMTRYGGFVNAPDGFRLRTHHDARLVIAALHDFDFVERVGSADSLANEPGTSGGWSMASSTILSRRSDSPGHLLAHAGAWNSIATPSGYYFSADPLRLTAQRRYCRGPPIAALLDEDAEGSGFPNVIAEEDFRVE